jgi:hypothetical protein
MFEIGRRTRTQAPPPWVIYEALTRPNLDPTRPWLTLVEDEVEPRIIESREPSLVVWSSLWPGRPGEVIRFEIEPGAGGSVLTWRLLTPTDEPDPTVLGRMRYRLNYLINGQLRSTFGL